jgi:DNA-binding CsgD family transcriptional regulator
MVTEIVLRAALDAVEAVDTAARLADVPAALLPVLIRLADAESAAWVELDATGRALRAIGCPRGAGARATAGFPGASGVLLRDLDLGTVQVSISLHRAAGTFAPAAVAALDALCPLLVRRMVPLVVPHDVLTARQRQVLGLVADGLTDRAIAHRLGCSRRTVTKHLEHVYRSLGVSCRAAAIAAWLGGQ